MTNLEQNPYIQSPKLNPNQFIGILADKIDLVLEFFTCTVKLDSQPIAASQKVSYGI